MKIAVIGIGGVGGYFGGKIAKAGFDVTFVARGETLKALQSHGLIVKSIQGDFKIDHPKVTDNISDIRNSDLIIMGVKAWQLKDIAKNLKSVISENTAVLPLQNGVLAIDELNEYLNPGHALGGLCRIISKIDSPGVINHFGVDPLIVFGEPDNSPSDRVKSIQEIFLQSGIHSKIATDIQAELWKKFISICVSGLLAITRSTYGQIREIVETRTLMIDLLKEIYRLSQAMGIHIEPEFVDKTVAYIDSFPYESTSSLARDVWDGKPSEIEYQNGTVVRLGIKYNVPTPINQFIYSCIMPMELKARKNK
jgi:2-dehydropantoate 2-reductase